MARDYSLPGSYSMILGTGTGLLFNRKRVSESIVEKKMKLWSNRHMVFFYDMSREIDNYAFDCQTNTLGNAFWETVKTSTTVTFTAKREDVDTRALWVNVAQIPSIPALKWKVTGLTSLVERQPDAALWIWTSRIYKDGIYEVPACSVPNAYWLSVEIPPIKGSQEFMDLGVTIEMLPIVSKPTNELLKVNPYIKDLSGNNRDLKLTNFLFSSMSGIGGYVEDWRSTKFIYKGTTSAAIDKTITSSTYVLQANCAVNPLASTKINIVKGSAGMTYYYLKSSTATTRSTMALNVGENVLPASYVNPNLSGTNYVGIFMSTSSSVDILIEQVPLYPDALVTDGVDDYGEMLNCDQGVKMLFYTCNPFKATTIFYDQRKNAYTFAIYNVNRSLAYNARNTGGHTYIDSNLNNKFTSNDLLNIKKTITIVNDKSVAANTRTPTFFSSFEKLYPAQLAFYNAIGFDAIPNKDEDGFDEQEFINYVNTNIIS